MQNRSRGPFRVFSLASLALSLSGVLLGCEGPIDTTRRWVPSSASKAPGAPVADPGAAGAGDPGLPPPPGSTPPAGSVDPGATTPPVPGPVPTGPGAGPAPAAPPGPAPALCNGGLLPAAVQMVLATRCVVCHGNPPLPMVPASFTTPQGFLGPARSEPGRTTAQVALTRIVTTSMMRMPPPPLEPLPAPESSILQRWFQDGMPLAGCVTPPPPTVLPPGPGSPPPVAPPPAPGPVTPPATGPATPPPAANPFAVPPICTSKVRWQGADDDDDGSPLMDPGVACLRCHSGDDDGDDGDDGDGGGNSGPGGGGNSGHGGGDDDSEPPQDPVTGAVFLADEGPRLAFAGTVYPTAHEPNQCYGAAAQGAQVVVTDANNRTFTVNVNAAGNFFSTSATPRPPFRAKVVFQGRERAMMGTVPSGDCNRCHTQNGTNFVAGTRVLAPGRILLP